MSKQINISEDNYKKFQAALLLTGEEEAVVINRLINKYTNTVFEKVLKKNTTEDFQNEKSAVVRITEKEQKQLFVKWFQSLTRNGKAYNPVTISGYTGRIENACSDPVFETVPVNNLFTITELKEFISIKKQIISCAGYAEFDAKSHNGFTAALKKYEDFLRFQASDDYFQNSSSQPDLLYHKSNIHRWTIEEDTICCKKFLEYYVINQSDMDIVQFLRMLAKEVPNVPEGSLRMKIQNIKFLSKQAGFKDTSTIKWLSQYSSQCKKAFEKAVMELGILHIKNSL
ncbi:MAG: hypothetical protein ACI4RU_03895 [Acutalibacteraceae bacterium]